MLKLKKKNLLFLTAAIGLLVFFHYINILRPIENMIIAFLKPLNVKVYNLSSSIRKEYGQRTEKQDIFNKLLLFEREVNVLISENARLLSLEEENEILRDHLNFLQNKKFNYLIANIVYSDINNDSTLKKEIIIDRGGKHGLIEDLAVVDSSGVIIGKISELKDNISKISLINDNKCRFAAVVNSSREITGLTEGELGLTVNMNFIPQNFELRVGEIVVSSGLEEHIPSGLPIGKIIQVNKSSNEVWQSAVLEPLANLDSAKIVSIILPE